MDLRETGWEGIDWLRTGISGGLLWTWEWTFRFHKRWRISWLLEGLLASQGFCSMTLVITASRSALRPIQPPIQWATGVISPKVKRTGR